MKIYFFEGTDSKSILIFSKSLKTLLHYLFLFFELLQLAFVFVDQLVSIAQPLGLEIKRFDI